MGFIFRKSAPPPAKPTRRRPQVPPAGVATGGIEQAVLADIRGEGFPQAQPDQIESAGSLALRTGFSDTSTSAIQVFRYATPSGDAHAASAHGAHGPWSIKNVRADTSVADLALTYVGIKHLLAGYQNGAVVVERPNSEVDFPIMRKSGVRAATATHFFKTGKHGIVEFTGTLANGTPVHGASDGHQCIVANHQQSQVYLPMASLLCGHLMNPEVRSSLHYPAKTGMPAIVLAKSLCETGNPYDRVMACIEYVNAMFSAAYLPTEIDARALQCYQVDYFLAQVNNGGFAQYVFNSRWDPLTIQLARQGLVDISAEQHLAWFDKMAEAVDGMGPELKEFLAEDPFAETPAHGWLSRFDDEFHALEIPLESAGKGVSAMQASFLAQQTDIEVLDDEELTQRLASLHQPDVTRRARLRLMEMAGDG